MLSVVVLIFFSYSDSSIALPASSGNSPVNFKRGRKERDLCWDTEPVPDFREVSSDHCPQREEEEELSCSAAAEQLQRHPVGAAAAPCSAPLRSALLLTGVGHQNQAPQESTLLQQFHVMVLQTRGTFTPVHLF